MRAEAIIAHDVEDKSKRAIVQHKINVAAECKTAYGFEISPGNVFRWTGESDLTLDRMLANKGNTTSEDRSALAEATRFLEDQLRDGEKPKWQLDEAAKGAGISHRSMERAKRNLGIKAQKKEMAGRWFWKLPEDRQGEDEDRQDFP